MTAHTRTHDYRVTLDCRSRFDGRLHHAHFREAPPFSGEQVWCYSCEQMSVVLYAPHEGRTRCLECSYETRGHLGIGVATQRATSHVERKPTHTVRVTMGARVALTVAGEFSAVISRETA